MFCSCCNVLIYNKGWLNKISARDQIDERSRRSALSSVPRVTNLRQLVLDGELILRIDVSDEFSQRRFGLKDNRLVETGDFEMLKLRQAAAGVRAQPRSQRRYSPVHLKFGRHITRDVRNNNEMQR